MKKFIYAGLIACTVGSLFIGCSRNDEPAPPKGGDENIAVKSIELDPSTLTTYTGQNTVIKAVITPDNATDKTVTWKSSDESIAVVDGNGQVTAAAVGTATITATTTDGNFKATCDVTVKSTVNLITLDIQKVSTPIAPKNPGNYDVWFVMAGSKIYYTNPSNTGIPQFMLAYDVTSNTFTDRVPNAELVGAGYVSKMVTDGGSLFYIANDAVKYSISGNSWTTLNYPPTAKDNNGETGVVVSSGNVYFLGGRTASTKFKYYDPSANSWFNAPDYPYAVETNDMVSTGGRIYALGGDASRKKFSYFNVTNSAWKTLPDLPFTATNHYNEHSVAYFLTGYIFALASNKIYIYDVNKEVWKDEPINVNIPGVYPNLFAYGSNTLYIASKTDPGNDFQLHKITVNF
ncbi:MAG: Ig-like domain-containing protein [Flavobacteriaceae bacterium]|jgi:hypothetical protein|nr:Ig-like domain-containing protein [Flavobacteriaceae bacterium]